MRGKAHRHRDKSDKQRKNRYMIIPPCKSEKLQVNHPFLRILSKNRSLVKRMLVFILNKIVFSCLFSFL